MKVDFYNVNIKKQIPLIHSNLKRKNVSFGDNGTSRITASLEGLASVNSSHIVKPKSRIIDKNTELFVSRQKQIKDISDLSPNNMMLVHVGDYFPENGIIPGGRPPNV